MVEDNESPVVTLDYATTAVAGSASFLDYATPDAAEPVRPEIESLLDGRASLREIAGRFSTRAAAARYLKASFGRRFAATVAGDACVRCGIATLDAIWAAWRFQIPPQSKRLTLSGTSHLGVASTCHACCALCAAALQRRSVLAHRIVVVGRACISVGTLLFLGGLLPLMLWRSSQPGKVVPVLLAGGVALFVVGGAVIAATRFVAHRLAVPYELRIALPEWLSFDAWGLPSTRAFAPAAVGGKMTDTIELSPEPLDAAATVATIAAVADPAAGGIDVFLGTTRAETRADGVELVALDYEAYEAMAVTQLRELVIRARERWPIVRCAILHRTGRVGLAEASVVVAVACPHRVAAFESCRFLIDELKKFVAIWKKEVWADGSVSWVHPETGVVVVEGPPAR